MKKQMQKYKTEAEGFSDFGGFIEYILEAFEDRPLNHFHSCNIIFEGEK